MKTWTFCALNIKRSLTNLTALFFHLVLPIAFYLIFGAALPAGETDIGFTDGSASGNFRAYVAIGMALFGGITAAVSTSTASIVELRSGWDRQLALTPLHTYQLLLSRFAVTATNVVLPVAAVFLLAWATGAEMSTPAWGVSFFVAIISSLPFGFYGLAWAQALRDAKATSLAAASVSLFMFAANGFMPLPDNLVQISRFTPLYGPVALSRYPLTHGHILSLTPDVETVDPWWWAAISIVSWTAIFIGVSILLEKREKDRR